MLTKRELVKRFRDDYVLVKAVAIALAENPQSDPSFDFLRWKPNVYAAQQTYKQAGITNPFKEIDIAQVHDCFTLTELLTYEDLGFCPPGESGKLIENGDTTLDGRLPVNTSGGLKAKGHPVGATGIAQTYEIYLQLTGQADKRQVKDARVGLTHNIGGSGATATVHIYRSDV